MNPLPCNMTLKDLLIKYPELENVEVSKLVRTGRTLRGGKIADYLAVNTDLAKEMQEDIKKVFKLPPYNDNLI